MALRIASAIHLFMACVSLPCVLDAPTATEQKLTELNHTPNAIASVATAEIVEMGWLYIHKKQLRAEAILVCESGSDDMCSGSEWLRESDKNSNSSSGFRTSKPIMALKWFTG